MLIVTKPLMGSSDLMGFSSIVGRICMQKSLTNVEGKHIVGCKASYTKNPVKEKCSVLFTVMKFCQSYEIMTNNY